MCEPLIIPMIANNDSKFSDFMLSLQAKRGTTDKIVETKTARQALIQPTDVSRSWVAVISNSK